MRASRVSLSTTLNWESMEQGEKTVLLSRITLIVLIVLIGIYKETGAIWFDCDYLEGTKLYSAPLKQGDKNTGEISPREARIP